LKTALPASRSGTMTCLTPSYAKDTASHGTPTCPGSPPVPQVVTLAPTRTLRPRQSGAPRADPAILISKPSPLASSRKRAAEFTSPARGRVRKRQGRGHASKEHLAQTRRYSSRSRHRWRAAVSVRLSSPVRLAGEFGRDRDGAEPVAVQVIG